MSIERVSRQAACLADPDRVQLLALLLSDPRGQSSAETLAAPGVDAARLRGHLEAMAVAGLLDRVRDGAHLAYRPTHDALTRFGALLGVPGRARRDDEGGEQMLQRIGDQLVARFAGKLSEETVRKFVEESYRLLEERAHVRTYLPVLTARFAADRLGALTASGAPRHGDRVDVLFVCVHNAGRSQLAAAALRTRARTRAHADIHVRTAGSVPAGRIDPAVLAVIERRGWSQALEFPKPLTDEIVRASDYVITMGCGDACPVVAGRTYLDWRLTDPAGRAAADVEVIADDVDRRVRTLLDVIGAAR